MIEPNKDPMKEKPGLGRPWPLALWDHLELGRLRGWELFLGPLRVHTTNVVSGLMLVALGMVFIAYEENGAVNLAYAAERWVSSFSRVVPDYMLMAVLAVAVVALALARVGAYLRKRVGTPETGSRDATETST